MDRFHIYGTCKDVDGTWSMRSAKDGVMKYSCGVLGNIGSNVF